MSQQKGFQNNMIKTVNVCKNNLAKCLMEAKL